MNVVTTLQIRCLSVGRVAVHVKLQVKWTFASMRLPCVMTPPMCAVLYEKVTKVDSH